jgi:hypothetical protein
MTTSRARGLREWFESLGDISTNAAVFDTRFNLSAAFPGRASKGIAGKLRHHAATLPSPPQSFFATKDSHVEPNGEARAREGALLGSKLDGIALHPASGPSALSASARSGRRCSQSRGGGRHESERG